MAISSTAFHIFRILNQLMTNLVGLQTDMNHNAQRWLAMAAAQNPDINTLVQFVRDAAASYQKRLGWVLTYKNTSPNWGAVTAMYADLGGDIAEATTLYTQMKAVADGLTAANLTTYAQVTSAANQVLAAVQASDSLWPE